MDKKMNKKCICVMQPPVTSPAVPPFNMAFVAGLLAGADADILLYDANLDFFLNFVFSEKCLDHHFNRIEQYNRDDFLPEKEYGLAKKCYHRLINSSLQPEDLKTDGFYQPDVFAGIKQEINDCLFLFSCAYYPWRVRWCTVEKKEDLAHANPFDAFCADRIPVTLDQVLPDVAILCADSNHQASATTSMVEFLYNSYSDIEIIFFAPSKVSQQIFRETPSICDYVHSFESIMPLEVWLHSRYGFQADGNDVIPDFSGLPLSDYLVPETVLPVDSFFSDKTPDNSHILKGLSETTGVRGVMLGQGLGAPLPDDRVFYSITTPMSEPKLIDDPQLKLVQWTSDKNETALNTKPMWKVSKKGIWNHVQITSRLDDSEKSKLLSFAASNPNIVHSFDHQEMNSSYEDPFSSHIDDAFYSYGKLAPIPGDPFWKVLDDPAYLLLYVNRFGKNDLFGLRTNVPDQGTLSLGNDICYYYQKPDDLPDGFLDEICRMVEAGGSVDTKFVRSNLERAYLIAYAMENGVIVGDSSLKHPREEFIDRIRSITGFDFTRFVERGYTSVRPEYRALGVGAQLLKGLTQRAGEYKIFSLIAEDNIATQKIAARNKTKKITTYFSEKAGKEMGIWMPEHMIDDGVS